MFVKDIQDSELQLNCSQANTKRKGKHNVEIEMTDTSEIKQFTRSTAYSFGSEKAQWR